ncbi:hypothetical protein SS21_24135 [Enterobacter roggenkampii]|nr:hypothetical protein SS21_24135 [Enterobacter roggenkampii]KJN50894.1 hypothetical protein SS51_24585 [Enterobacter roggenkampii]
MRTGNGIFPDWAEKPSPFLFLQVFWRLLGTVKVLSIFGMSYRLISIADNFMIQIIALLKTALKIFLIIIRIPNAFHCLEWLKTMLENYCH